MFGNAKQSEGSSAESRTSKGTAYDVCRKVKQEDGTEKLVRIGTVFIRNSGTGGAAWITGDDRKKHELVLFSRSGRKPKEASEQEAEVPAEA